jgi:hypothetical protein
LGAARTSIVNGTAEPVNEFRVRHRNGYLLPGSKKVGPIGKKIDRSRRSDAGFGLVPGQLGTQIP